jgi:2-(1,2-epoxy-1,2-dihydrophenyl)acetyl-CoA isomerase
VDFEHIRLEQHPASFATVTIARPDRLNALSAQTVDELRAAVEVVGASGARCLLLTGEGRGFSSGADLAAGGGLPEDAGEALEKHFNPLVEALFALDLPVVAAVNGPCAGAGCSLALWRGHRDRGALGLFPPGLRQYRPDSRRWSDLAAAAARRPGAGDGDDAARRARAREKALAWGIVSRVVDDEDLMEEASRATRPARARTDRRPQASVRRLARDAEQLLSLAERSRRTRRAARGGRTQDVKAAVALPRERRQPTFEDAQQDPPRALPMRAASGDRRGCGTFVDSVRPIVRSCRAFANVTAPSSNQRANI